MYNTTVEHYPFQKGFMFGIYWENQEMGASIGSFGFIQMSGVNRSITEFGKSIKT
jgi:hypothetical protein